MRYLSERQTLQPQTTGRASSVRLPCLLSLESSHSAESISNLSDFAMMPFAKIATWDNVEADAEIRRGLSVEIAGELQSLFQLSNEEMAQLIGRSLRAYMRFRNEGLDLGPAEAERVVRYVRLVNLAAETFGEETHAVAWMQESNRQLGGRTPIEMAKTEPGASVVHDLLVGIQHGHPA